MSAQAGETGLFRQQVLLLRHDNDETGALITRAPSLMWFSVLAALLFVLLLYLLLMTRYKETVQARGILQASGSSQTVTAPADLLMQELLVSQGEQVRAGQALAVLSGRRYDGQGRPVTALQLQQLDQQQRRLRQELQLAESLKTGEQQQLQIMLGSKRRNLASLDREQDLLQEQLQISREQISGLETLLAQSGISRADYQRQRLAHLDIERQYHAMTRQRAQLQQQIRAQEESLRILTRESELLTVQNQGKLDALVYRSDSLRQQETVTLVAEQAGIVAGITVAEGDAVRANQPVMRVQDDESGLQVVAYVPSSIVGKLVPGQELLLSFDAFNHMHYGRYAAHIEQISRLPIDPRQQMIPVPGINEPVFRLTARLDQQFVEGPEIYPLQAGLLLSADFITAELTLFNFILKPVLELRGRVG